MQQVLSEKEPEMTGRSHGVSAKNSIKKASLREEILHCEVGPKNGNFQKWPDFRDLTFWASLGLQQLSYAISDIK